MSFSLGECDRKCVCVCVYPFLPVNETVSVPMHTVCVCMGLRAELQRLSLCLVPLGWTSPVVLQARTRGTSLRKKLFVGVCVCVWGGGGERKKESESYPKNRGTF